MGEGKPEAPLLTISLTPNIQCRQEARRIATLQLRNLWLLQGDAFTLVRHDGGGSTFYFDIFYHHS